MAPAVDPPGNENDNDNSDNYESLAKNRSRRQKVGKAGKFAAFEKLKKAKASGEKNKYEGEEEKDVYELVNEDQYSKIVQDRQDDDWIVDDDGSGYVEDGREIFDDDIGEAPTKDNKNKDEKKKKNHNIVRPGTKPKSNIKSMFMAQAAGGSKKKQEKDVSLANDELLGDLMADLHKGPDAGIKPVPIKLKKKPVGSTKSPFNPFSTSAKPVSQSLNVKPIKQEIRPSPVQNQSKPYTAVAIKKPLPKPNIPDSNDYDEVDGMDIETVDTSVQNCTEQDDSGLMELNDVDFDENVDEEMSAGGEMTAVKVKEEKEEIPLEALSTGWTTFKEEMGSSQSEKITDIEVDSSHLPLVTNESGDQVLRFYWLDAYEDQYSNPGVVYLFGKVWIESAEAHVSCCVTVKNIERRIFVLPRPTKYLKGEDTGSEVSIVDVYNEFNERVAEKYKIPKFKSKKVTKQYAFEKVEVPVESDYMEIRYSADSPALPSDLSGNTFSHVFGTHVSSLEHLVLETKMKGPSWLDIKCPQISTPPISWCKLEVFVTRPDHITVINDASLSPPPLVVMTFNMRTLPNPKTHQNEIIGIACLIQKSLAMDKPAPKLPFQEHFCAITKPNDCIFPYDFRDKSQKENNMKIEQFPSERPLLGFLLAKIHKIDPDVIVGHDIYGFDLDVLLHRINVNKIPHWSKIGRLKRTKMPKLSGHPGMKSGYTDKTSTCGRLACDVMISARELLRCRSYDLTELTNQILHQKRKEIEYEEIRNMYLTSQHLLKLIELTLLDSTYILRIMYELNVIPLALQITNICGNVMTRTLMGGRSERNEYLLLHAFTEKNFIVPDKEYKKKQIMNDGHDDEDLDGTRTQKTQGKRKPAYAGGLVLEPKKGFYDKFILLLDFNSLYPSIIQEYNICFTTVNREAVNKSINSEEGELVEVPDSGLEPGILPTEIRKLVESRRQVKQLMKGEINQEQYIQYDIRQKALKLTANSMYGCLGFTYSRFYAKPLAALITGKGREILMKTKDTVQAMNLDVIYGDTDSIMINTNCTEYEQVFKIGNRVKTEINKLYRLLEIDIDYVFKSMLLLKKKKYAALSIKKLPDGSLKEEKEMKGLDIVRRDWCDLAKEAGEFVVGQILSGENRELIVETIHSKLIEVGEKVKNNDIPVELYYISKQLTKNPEDYPDKKSLPHVQVAMRFNSKGGRKMKAGDTVAYVVCEDGSTLPASQRAYHPDELAKSETLKIDTKYYLSNQVHPVIARLCDPIDGTDAAHLAECLGLDPSGYKHAAKQEEMDDDDALLGGVEMSDEEKYKDCHRFKFTCPGPTCGREIIFDGVFTGAEQFLECTLSKCPNKDCEVQLAGIIDQLVNQLTNDIRQHVRSYYQGWMKCEDTACGMVTRKLPLTFQRGHPICSACNKGILHTQTTDSWLYTQLCFYQHVFDYERAKMKLSDKEQSMANTRLKDYKEHYDILKNVTTKWLRKNAYSEVNLTKLFDGLSVLKTDIKMES
ncbi:DNA polymerase alpha catalytic subunit-like [Mytilus californianus]|uniref:DNA polymerase alpha catalytic subunit-like n=1 Tax=Mytilus californianus TaxID=6549 RepID=UPI0022453087|nr:DNA polymerase alpha catalytic subunit-like [Mytilus californianus]